MAIFHLSIKTISRSAGRSATAAIAYRAGERVLDERTGLIHDYERRKGVEHTEIFLPENSPTWASNRAQLWNAAEQAETRKNSTVAREFEVALPAELNKAQRLALVREFASELVQRHGVAVDVAIHEPGNEGDHRNHHAHILVTTRRLTADGFSEKTRELDNQRSGEVEHWRARWAQLSNRHLEISGSQGRIDHRSLAAQREGALARGDYDQAANLDRMPTTHLGPNVVQMEKRGIRTERGAINRDAHSHNAQVTQLAEVRQQIEKEKTRLSILERPDHLLGLLDAKLAVFREVDISRELAQYFSAEEAALVRVEVFRSADLVNLTPERADGAVFATREMIAAEKALAETAERMTSSSRHAVPASKVFAVLDSEPFGVLSEEQRGAVLHITTQADISAITGSAGSGKSTALAAAREVWESQGYRVRGAALAGKAADGLQEGAGIESRTLHALEFALKSGADQLTRRDVLVIDEAGMVGSRQLGRVIELARLAGAKVVLVGDAEQLQPIEAGAAFRVVCERVGVADIATIRRQREDWAKEASQAFARGDTSAGLAAYQERGAVRLEDDRAGARAGLVADWLADKTEGNRIILAHTNADVQAINGAIRQARHEAGDLSRDASFQSARGLREFAAGDRMVFLKNDRALGVKNGMLGTVEQADSGRLSVILDNG
ncbi:MAG: Ti-type conjugative transfer relaxase TraA, partial [Polaromonas sp.]|nr:Ti-type conjugative transfer relaxase TraA [Polaromonas sp.]